MRRSFLPLGDIDAEIFNAEHVATLLSGRQEPELEACVSTRYTFATFFNILGVRSQYYVAATPI